MRVLCFFNATKLHCHWTGYQEKTKTCVQHHIGQYAGEARGVWFNKNYIKRTPTSYKGTISPNKNMRLDSILRTRPGDGRYGAAHIAGRPHWQMSLGKATLTNVDDKDMVRVASLHSLVVTSADLVLHASRTIHSTDV